MAELPQEAKDIYNRALDIGAAAFRNNKVDGAFWHDYAGLMSLAIKKSGNVPFAEAHCELSRALMVLGKVGEAERELNIALIQDPNLWDAQLYKVAIAADKLQKLPGAKDFVHIETQNYGRDGVDHIASTVIGSILGTLGKATVSAIGAGLAANTHSAFKAEVEKLITICTNFCETNTDVDTYLKMSETLIELGDEIARMPLIGSRPNLYDAVVNLSTAKLDARGREHEITDIRNKAEGKSLLLKG
ncbi:MAG TPA: hypothetical protein VFD70_24650 [Anaerolineae bacterium]|nr:hypothetical protein [Anaerolineae bacterium]